MAQSKKKVWSKPAVERLQMPADPEAPREVRLERGGIFREIRARRRFGSRGPVRLAQRPLADRTRPARAIRLRALESHRSNRSSARFDSRTHS